MLEFQHIIHRIRQDRTMKHTITLLCIGSTVISVFMPMLSTHNAVLGLVTNLLWLYGSDEDA